MRYKTFSILALLIFSHSITWAFDKPLIDPEYKKVEEKIKEEKQECKKLKNPYKRISCAKKIRKKYRDEGKIRGTEEYCEFNYLSLSFKEMEKLFRKLKAQQKTARNSYDVMYDEDWRLGEITKEDLQTEIIWIESRLARMQKKKIKKLEKSME